MAASFGKSSARRRQARTPFSDINVTPMVDVMLVLLVIFMVAAPMMTTGVTVNLPQSKASPVAGQDEPLVITVTADGKVFLQKTQLDPRTLAEKLRAIAAAKKDTRIFVRGDRNIDYGHIMQVVGEINAAGFTKVALITDASSADRDNK